MHFLGIALESRKERVKTLLLFTVLLLGSQWHLYLGHSLSYMKYIRFQGSQYWILRIRDQDCLSPGNDSPHEIKKDDTLACPIHLTLRKGRLQSLDHELTPDWPSFSYVLVCF